MQNPNTKCNALTAWKKSNTLGKSPPLFSINSESVRASLPNTVVLKSKSGCMYLYLVWFTCWPRPEQWEHWLGYCYFTPAKPSCLNASPWPNLYLIFGKLWSIQQHHCINLFMSLGVAPENLQKCGKSGWTPWQQNLWAYPQHDSLPLHDSAL